MPDPQASIPTPLPTVTTPLEPCAAREHETLASIAARVRADVLHARTARKKLLQASKRAREIMRLEASLHEHRSYPTFWVVDDPWKRQVYFGCETDKLLARVSLLTLKQSQSLESTLWELPRVSIPVRSRRSQAEARAHALLHQFLTREQRSSLRASDSFLVTGQDGRTYEVTGGQGVRLIVEGRPVVSYCIHPRERLPGGDVMLAQKLLLETNIRYFLATANATQMLLTGT